MMFPILFLLFFLGSNNYRKAQSIGLNPLTWVLWTALAFALGIFVACMILGSIILFKNPQLLNLAKTNNRSAMNEFMIQDFANNNFLYSSLIMAGAFGGYLLVKYLLEKRTTN
ncbi:MAG: hypothetical protein IT256_00085 [Chitinophagaceae bacterium]|nr:hypothetical protein [Chitinophagaceae bacterium]